MSIIFAIRDLFFDVMFIFLVSLLAVPNFLWKKMIISTAKKIELKSSLLFTGNKSPQLQKQSVVETKF